jgi:hypothetical protein
MVLRISLRISLGMRMFCTTIEGREFWAWLILVSGEISITQREGMAMTIHRT